MEVTRADVCWAEIAPRSGSEQSGRRPVVIVSHNAFNENVAWQSLIVVPLSTSANQARGGPTVIPLKKGSGGVPKSCVALCHQVTTLDRSKLTKRIGHLSDTTMEEIARGLAVALALM
jgi:mRNA interferase MazF